MRKINFIFLLVFCVFIYIFSAMHSFHQVHRSIYYNDKQLSKSYVEWYEVRENVRDFINSTLLDKLSKKKEFKQSGEMGILVAGVAGKFVEHITETYINPDGLSLLLKSLDKKSEIPEPNLGTLIGGISIMRFDSLNTFNVILETNGEKIPVHFKRTGVKWKIVEVGFTNDFFDKVIK